MLKDCDLLTYRIQLCYSTKCPSSAEPYLCPSEVSTPEVQRLERNPPVCESELVVLGMIELQNLLWLECGYVLDSGKYPRVEHIVEEATKNSEATEAIVEVVGERHVVGEAGVEWW